MSVRLTTLNVYRSVSRPYIKTEADIAEVKTYDFHGFVCRIKLNNAHCFHIYFINHYAVINDKKQNVDVNQTRRFGELGLCLGWYGHLMVLYKNTYVRD